MCMIYIYIYTHIIIWKIEIELANMGMKPTNNGWFLPENCDETLNDIKWFSRLSPAKLGELTMFNQPKRWWSKFGIWPWTKKTEISWANDGGPRTISKENEWILVICYIAIENGPFSLLIHLLKMVIFHSKLLVYRKINGFSSRIQIEVTIGQFFTVFPHDEDMAILCFLWFQTGPQKTWTGRLGDWAYHWAQWAQDNIKAVFVVVSPKRAQKIIQNIRVLGWPIFLDVDKHFAGFCAPAIIRLEGWRYPLVN